MEQTKQIPAWTFTKDGIEPANDRAAVLAYWLELTETVSRAA